MKRFLFIITLIMSTGMLTKVHAQENKYPEGPKLDFVCQLNVTLGGTFTLGKTPQGTRTVIPITGGTFEGPYMKGKILSGGADYQMADEAGYTHLEAIYCIQTDDGTYIHVRNTGIIALAPDQHGNMQYYFRAAPKFEAPNDGKYGWLNRALFVCAVGEGNGAGITLNVWKVE